ncbi:MAG: gliding motility lipoprotein GldH [Bacteroidales bacterium]
MKVGKIEIVDQQDLSKEKTRQNLRVMAISRRCSLLFLLLCSITILVGCSGRERHHEFRHMANSTWAFDDTLNFVMDSVSSKMACEVSLELRLGRGYPYRDLWMDIERLLGDSIIGKESVCMTLYDDYGSFLADGFGNSYQIGRVVFPNIILPDSTAYTFRVRHIMSDLYLSDIHDVGIRVRRIE